MSPQQGDEPGASKEAVRHHYDISDDFYRLWLDERRVYSCALWADGDTDDQLDLAQLRKLDAHAIAARALGAERVLDVGCGWGAFLQRCVSEHGVKHAVGITTSLAHARAASALGDPRLDVRAESFLEHRTTTPYDAIVSVEAFEAFARPELTSSEKIEAYRAFFARCQAWLRPSGYLSLQLIAYGNLASGGTAPFIVRDVFPESELPRLGEVIAALEGLFEVELVENHRAMYERTCRIWLRRLRAERERATALVGEAVVKRFADYLYHSRVGFALGALGLYRLTLRRIDQLRE